MDGCDRLETILREDNSSIALTTSCLLTVCDVNVTEREEYVPVLLFTVRTTGKVYSTFIHTLFT